MSTLAENIQQAISDFDTIQTAIVNKGVEVPSGTATSSYGTKIGEISSGGIVTEPYGSPISAIYCPNRVNSSFTPKPYIDGTADQSYALNDFTYEVCCYITGYNSSSYSTIPILYSNNLRMYINTSYKFKLFVSTITYIESGFVVPTNELVTIAVTRSGNTCKVYLDSVLQNEIEVTTNTIAFSGMQLMYYSSSCYLKGEFHSLRVYDSALDATTIATHYQTDVTNFPHTTTTTE